MNTKLDQDLMQSARDALDALERAGDSASRQSNAHEWIADVLQSIVDRVDYQ